LPQGDSFPLSYDKFADVYGRSVIEKSSTPIKLATTEHIERLKKLIEGLKVEKETIDKWFTKCGVESFEDMSQEQIGSLITHCEKQIKELAGAR